MEMFGKIRCITFKELVSGPKPIISKPNYDKKVRNGEINVIQRGGNGRVALIEYNSLPSSIKTAYDSIYPNAVEQIKKQLMSDRIVLDSAARDFFASHKLSDGKHLPNSVIDEYTLNASVLNEMIKKENDTNALHHKLGSSKRSLVWEIVIGTCNELRKQYAHTLPNNECRLRRKMNEYKNSGYKVLISGKWCNENTLKITEEAGNYIIALKRCRVPVYTNAQIFEEFNKNASAKGFKQLKSLASLTNFLSRPEVEPLWFDAVHGELAARQRYQRKNKTKLPAMRDALWYGDGTKLNLYYKAYEKNRLVVKTTSVYEVVDAYSEVLLGYYISDNEDYEAQYNSYRMAIGKAMCKPYEIVCDNQGGHKKLDVEGMFKRICRVGRRTAPYSGQSKTIESIFGRMQKTVLHKEWNFTGMNITAKMLDSRQNIEFIEANKEKLPTLEEVKKIYAKARAEWNNSAHPETGISRIEMYNTSSNPETEKISLLDTIDMFWLKTQKQSTFTSAGITISVNKKKYTYEVYNGNDMPDMDFRSKYTNAQFYVMYDPNDMTIVRLYEKDHSGLRYVAEAQPYREIHRALQEQTHDDSSFIRQMDAINKQQRIERVTKGYSIEEAFGTNPESFGLNRPKLKGLNMGKVEKSIAAQQMKLKNTGETETIDIGKWEKELSYADEMNVDGINYSKY